MDFISFLEASNVPTWWHSRTVISCSSNEYPVLFFPALIERYKNKGVGDIRVIDLNDVSIDTTTAILSSSFLGNRSYYWLKNISELDAKSRAYWLSYVQSYSGPNCLLFFCNGGMASRKNDSFINVEIPDQFDQTVSASVFNFLMPNDLRRCSLVVRTVFKRRRKISLDAICLLTRYMTISEADLELFLTDWLDTIIVPDASLFDLSKYLFARDQKSFFRVWQSMADRYSELFWIAYWGDIFWRAYHFSRLSALGDHEQAKKFAVRLPFSFIQGGWRQVPLNELKEALNYVYMLDNDIKNGMQGYLFLELLYLKFFLKYF